LANLIFQESFIRNHFKYEGSENIPPLLEMLKNTSLNLVDSHYAMRYPRPYHSNVIEIGGLTIKEVKPLPPVSIFCFVFLLPELPALKIILMIHYLLCILSSLFQDLQDLMDKATDGVIYFTIGSHLKSSELSPGVIETLVSAFGKLKQKVLWKWDEAPMANKSDNIVLGSWFPQNSILSNSNNITILNLKKLIFFLIILILILFQLIPIVNCSSHMVVSIAYLNQCTLVCLLLVSLYLPISLTT
jgi:hypothetical protein